MIVLTDGAEDGLTVISLMKFEYKQMVQNGIKVITIGLGDEIDSEFLHGIATKTNGKYLYASDSNMLSDLEDILGNHVTKPDITIDGEEYTLIADSGFKIGRDNFNFENFGSADSPGGICYGFAYLSRLIYLNKFESSGEAVEGSAIIPNTELIAYTLTENNKNRMKKGQVYDINLNNNYNTMFNIIGDEKDYRYLDANDFPRISEKYKQIAEGTGFDFYIRELEEDEYKELTIDGITKKYNKYESLQPINFGKDIVISDENKDDYQILQLINRFYRYQKHAVGAVLMDNLDKIYNKIGPNFYQFDIKYLTDKLNEGDPVLLTIKCSLGNHSVLATKVYKSNNSDNYVIGIYDSNAPHEEALATVTRVNSILGISRYTFEFNSAGLSFDSMAIDSTLLSLAN